MKAFSFTLIVVVLFLQDAYSQQQQFNFGNSYSSVHSTSGGNNIIISHRLGPNNEPEDYISVSIPPIRIDGDYFSCSTLICPQSTYKCSVVSEAVLENETKMKTIAECLDKTGNVVERKEYLENNPMPNIKPPYSRHSIVDREGSVEIEDSSGQNVFNSKKMSKKEQEEMMNQINRETARIHEHQQKMQQNFQAQMQKFQEDMQKAFGNGFPFGNQGFPFAPMPYYYPTFPTYFPNYNSHSSSSYSQPAQYSTHTYSAPYSAQTYNKPYNNEQYYDETLNDNDV